MAAGDERGAARALAEALELSARDGDQLSVAGHLWYFGEILGGLDLEPEVVGVLEGIVTEGSLAPLMTTVGGRELELHQRSVESARRRCGTERFDRLLARGAAMAYEEAVDYSRNEVDRILAELDDA
jgi:hypothetical protein